MYVLLYLPYLRGSYDFVDFLIQIKVFRYNEEDFIVILRYFLWQFCARDFSEMS